MTNRKVLFSVMVMLLLMGQQHNAVAETQEVIVADGQIIDQSAQNTSSSYVNYTDEWQIPADKELTFRSARYTYIYNKVSGEGKINLYSGGERTFIGNSSKAFPDWSGLTDDMTWCTGKYPLLFDSNRSKKAAYWGVHAALRQAAGVELDIEAVEETSSDDTVFDLCGQRVYQFWTDVYITGQKVHCEVDKAFILYYLQGIKGI